MCTKKLLLITAQSRIANCKQPKYSSVVEWINKCWYDLKTEHYKVVKVNELWLHGTTWMNIQNIIWGKKSKSPLDYDSIFIK